MSFKWHDSRLTWLEGIFARGDRRLADVIETAQRLGARFDGWSDRCRLDLWDKALATHEVDSAFYLRRRPLDEALPWDHIDAGVSKKWLARELAKAVEGVLTPDCSIERCTYCGACDFEEIRNRDFHPEGAKGSLHHGDAVSRWAEMLVPDSEGDPTLPEWETRTWRKIRSAVRAGHRTGRTPIQTRPDAPLPQPLQAASTSGVHRSGDGNAEEWLGATPTSLQPPATATPAVQRLRVRYRKIDTGRFIGTREMGTVFLRATRRAGLPIAFSSGHRPLPKISFGPALPLGCSSDDEYVDIDLTEPRAPDAVVQALATELPAGLVPVSAGDIDRKTPSIDSTTTACLWEVDVSQLDSPPLAEPLRQAIGAFLGADTFAIRKIIKGKQRTIDARPRVRSMHLVGLARVEVEIEVGGGATISPGLLVGEMLGLSTGERLALRAHKLTTRFGVSPESRVSADA